MEKKIVELKLNELKTVAGGIAGTGVTGSKPPVQLPPNRPL